MRTKRFSLTLGVTAITLSLLGAQACKSDGSKSKTGEDAGDSDGGENGGPAALEDPVGADAPVSEGSAVTEVPGDEECPAWAPADRPTAELPDEHEREYLVELERWGIDNDDGDPVETRAALNEAIEWAVDNDFDLIVLPEGTYHLGEPTNDVYAGGIELPANMTLDLSLGARLKMATNDRWNYCVVTANNNVTIRGGEIIGDRETHEFEDAEKSGHDEGHGICVWTGIERVLVEDMELHELTGDGILVLGRKGADGEEDDPSVNVTIRRNKIHHNRRQGVSVVGGHQIVISENEIHHIEGTAPQFGVDIEGAGRTDEDIHIFQNRFHHNAGGDIVTSTGRNVWIEENSMIQCQVDSDGAYDPELPCDLERQIDAPIIIWKETDNVILNNSIRMSKATVNGFYGILGYTGRDGPVRENPVGNYIAGNTFYDAGIHLSHNMRYFVSNNTINEGLLLGYLLGCTRLEGNQINRTKSENYKLRNVAGVASGNVLNRTEGAPEEEDVPMHFPMANDAPYRNSSPVFW